MSDAKEKLTEAELRAIESRLAKIPEGPYFVDFDDAKDCPDHANSGLALVDTGRTDDWPIARLCHWPVAEFIRHAREDIPKLIAAVRADIAPAGDVESKEAVAIMKMVCQRLVNVEQPDPKQRCGYCQQKKHAPFCIVAAARDALKLREPKGTKA